MRRTLRRRDRSCIAAAVGAEQEIGLREHAGQRAPHAQLEVPRCLAPLS